MPNKQINVRPDANSLTTREINIFTPKYIETHEKQDQWHAIFSNQLFQTRALLEPALRNVEMRNGKSHDLGGFDDTYENLS